MVMENQEMVMEKLWKNILSSLWEPWNENQLPIVNLASTPKLKVNLMAVSSGTLNR